MIDLHTHSTASDGSLSSKELIEYALQKKLKTISLTDHNTLENVEECVYWGKQVGIEVIPGVEISAETYPELHILAYFFDERYLKMQSWFSFLNHRRTVGVPLKMIKILQELGYKKIDMKYVTSLSEDGLFHVGSILTALVKKRYFKTQRDAYRELFAPGKAAYIPVKPTTEEIFSTVRAHGGISVLAHPTNYQYDEMELKNYITQLKMEGLNGIEIYHSDVPKGLIPVYESWAVQLGLLATGGSDFHGKLKPSIEIGVGRGDLHIDNSLLEKMKKYYALNLMQSGGTK